MNAKGTTPVPLLICLAVIGTACVLQMASRRWAAFDFFSRLEWMTYDWRVRIAARHPTATAPNLGFVFISDDSISAVQDGLHGKLPYRFGLYWPRQVYGRLVEELAAQGATVVGFDILFADRRPDHPPVRLDDGSELDSDLYFARALRQAGNVILAADKGLPPDPLFRTNALAVADISAHRESDGILRRARAFEDIRLWHPLIRDAARLLGWDLRQARLQPGRVTFPLPDGTERHLPITAEHHFNQAQLFEELTGRPAPPTAPVWAEAFTVQRCWQMGLVLAARALELDLARARIEPERGRIVLTGPGGITRTIPVDAEGRFYIDWTMTPYHPALTQEAIESLLEQHEDRRAGRTEALTNRWQGKLVVVGSVATGNDLTDLGATPLEKETYLFCQQWNVANALLTGRFVRPPSLPLELGLIGLLGAWAGVLSWRRRVLVASGVLLISAVLYGAAAVWMFVQGRVWLPLVLPVGGALLGVHAGMVTYRVIHEQQERRRINAIFGRVVSPNVRDELLQARALALGGVRRDLTVMFADIRGFTELTDASQARAEESARRRQLSGPAAQAHFEEFARGVLDTVNLYLGLLADTVKQFDGTLDKYIGDCVMAFWGAPTPHPGHAAACVRAMIQAQRAIGRLNQERAAFNQRLEAENAARVVRGEEPGTPLPVLSVGIGINTGLATVGLIGSENHLLNYTAFGHEVNVAARLEELAGPGCILIAEATLRALEREDPALAAACRERPPVALKGLRAPVRHFEVLWRESPVEPAPGA